MYAILCIKIYYVYTHTSLKYKLGKNNFPEERTIYSESSRPGDFKNDLETGLAYNVALNSTKDK